jgi:integrase
MAETTPHGVDDPTDEHLRQQARLQQPLLEAEARAILDRVPPVDRSAIAREAEAIRRSLEGRYTGDSTAEIRAARDNDYQEGPSSPRRVDGKVKGETGNREPATWARRRRVPLSPSGVAQPS